MTQCAGRIAVPGDTSSIEAAVVQGLLQLGHPRNQIQLQSGCRINWANAGAVRLFFERVQLDLVYLVDPAGDMDPLQNNTSREPAGDRILAHDGLISAASTAGVHRLMHVATSGAHHELQRCASLATEDLDYRSVRTYQPYGAYRPGPVPLRVARSARVIESLLHQFTEAALHGDMRVAIEADPQERLDLMYSRDVAEAEAIIHVVDLPRSELAAANRHSSLHIDIGAEHYVCMYQPIEVAALAAGFHGRSC